MPLPRVCCSLHLETNFKYYKPEGHIIGMFLFFGSCPMSTSLRFRFALQTPSAIRHPPSRLRLLRALHGQRQAHVRCQPKLHSGNASETEIHDMIRLHHDHHNDYHNGVAALVHSEPQVSNFQNPYDIPLLIGSEGYL